MGYMKPIHKYNNGKGATLCNKCSVVIKEDLVDELYCNKCGEEPEWVCMNCANERGAVHPPNHISSWHFGICGICGEEKSVTEPRDFGITRKLLKVEEDDSK